MSTLTAPPPALLAPARVTPAPAAEPPFDAGARRAALPAVAGNLALRCPPPGGTTVAPPLRLRVLRPSPCRPPGAAAPEPEYWGALLARGIVEVIAGDRPVTQLVHWTAPHVYDVLCRRALAATSVCTAERVARPRAMTGRVHVCRPAGGVAEVTCVVHGRERAWALAFRLEKRHDRWLCTELLLG